MNNTNPYTRHAEISPPRRLGEGWREQITKRQPSHDNIRSNYRVITERMERWRACPECGRSGDELAPVYISSPPWRWEALCGRAGWVLTCPVHKTRQLGFELVMMN